MILTFIPWCPKGVGNPPGQDLFLAYDACMSRLFEDDWGCFYDSDAMGCTKFPYRLIEAAVEARPDAGAFVGMTAGLISHRSGWQMIPELEKCHDIVKWQGVARSRFEEFGIQMEDVTDIEDRGKGNGKNWAPFSGAGFCVSKKTWDVIDRTPAKSFVHVDHKIHHRIAAIGKRIYLLKGWTIYHWGMDARDFVEGKKPETMGGVPF